MKTNLLFLCLAALPSAFASVVVGVSGPATAPVIGQTFTVSVNISGVTDLYDWQTDLNYDPAALSVVAIDEGPFLATAGGTFFIPGSDDPVNGTISNNADTLLGPGPGASGSGVLFIVDFQALSVGKTSLSLSTVILQDSQGSDISATINSGTVNVTPTPEPPALSLMAAALAITLLRPARFRLVGSPVPRR